ncbi:gliding motility-associated C-terminal domain-containing protein [Myroides marinus]|uniref:gliding motility-associated C-terminal domain-containing protein n=1 Tax=Myroides marinus TaxID=703342 RepID=UPI002577C7A6|nr:gliding motility-associated C-terminal domain-containing protein [Myroides marinus]MDM1384184.1 gliding motility-associated C-terminal domain-containing protein [Myroides marinus]MDM1533049.1 gliding motility-associated C-terminal domain-containing protein [Myroides marinus]MDM1539974.1 gliding motility-associated C-terminal domain-containing protein [Myroides marinus]
MKKKNTLGLVLLSGVLLCFTEGSAQEKLSIQNTGELTVSENEVFTVLGKFENQKGASFTNSGEVHFFDDFSNEGFFMFSKTASGSKVFFSQQEGVKEKKKISGGKNLTELENVYFNTAGIDLQNDISIAGKASFERGNVVVNVPLEGSITFKETASIAGVSDSSHVHGTVDKEGKKELVMPVGDGVVYRPITFGESKDVKDIFQATYKKSNPLLGREHKERNSITEINNAEYWEVDNRGSSKNIILSLSWDERTTPSSLLANPEKGLHILRWDDIAKKWVDEGGIVDVVNKTVKTPIEVTAKGIFTLGLVDTDYNSEIKIYNAVSPNGDGLNDYFIITGINKYPNTVQIVNRWGSKVYESSNYDVNGDGSMNVFKGEAEGKGVSSKGKLPTGTYYYVVKYEVRTAKGSETVTKSGYLHLENN